MASEQPLSLKFQATHRNGIKATISGQTATQGKSMAQGVNVREEQFCHARRKLAFPRWQLQRTKPRCLKMSARGREAAYGDT